MSAPKFSIVTMARNEAENIPALLATAMPFIAAGGDFLVVDTGSKDETAQLARDAGARVIQMDASQFDFTVDAAMAEAVNEEFIDPSEPPIIQAGDTFFDFGRARNLLMSLALNDMIFSIDADEVILRLDIDLCNKVIDEGWGRLEQDYTDIRLGIHYFLNYRWYDRRVFHFEGIMHELICGNGKMGRLPPEACSVEHRPKTSGNRKNYLPAMGYMQYTEPDRCRQAHWFARELMASKRYRSAIRLFLTHVMMPDCHRGDI
jgi:glycosyltransferase involved in cell wall biosynthesis